VFALEVHVVAAEFFRILPGDFIRFIAVAEGDIAGDPVQILPFSMNGFMQDAESLLHEIKEFGVFLPKKSG
jgi:hypothetical protein